MSSFARRPDRERDDLTTHPAIERVRAHAELSGLAIEVVRFPSGTHTAEDAARAIGCYLAQIVKSLVFLAGDGVVIVLLSGADRVDEAKLSAALQAPQARRATAKEVRDRTGFAVGGVPPFGHGPSVRVVFDHALLGYDTVWAAAGLPDAVFSSPPAELARASGAVVADVRI